MSAADVRRSIAYSEEATILVDRQYLQVLNYSADAGGLNTYREAMANGMSLSDVRWSIGHSYPAAVRVDEIYQQVLEHQADGNGLAAYQDGLGRGMSLSEVRWSIAHSSEAEAEVKWVWSDILLRPVEDSSLAYWQDAMGNGTTLYNVRSFVAYSGEAAGKVRSIWSDLLERSVEDSSQAYWQGAMASGTTLRDVRSFVAHSAEAAGKIGNIWSQVLEHPAAGSDISAWQDAIGGGNDLYDVRWEIAHSAEAAGKVQGLFAAANLQIPANGELELWQDALGINQSMAFIAGSIALVPTSYATVAIPASNFTALEATAAGRAAILEVAKVWAPIRAVVAVGSAVILAVEAYYKLVELGVLPAGLSGNPNIEGYDQLGNPILKPIQILNAWGNGPPASVDVGQQDKHIVGTNNYDPARGRSILTANPQELLDRYSGKSEPVSKAPRGQEGFREQFDTRDQIIGIHRDRSTGVESPTTRGTIHYSGNKAHIVPARPKSDEGG